ncbi:long-chain-acyl-CoA synthetase [Marinicauda algicola]|uniref:Long-chain-acyl-CoA synthetase n=1 Tax=Marinicauda algicola TaxID=2029849 RepID=A0A4S2H3L0_9PROT|nr:long-chain-acyl-CoA synthetase [Marinicauda algicola]TGY90205.1 long-chain-acyl-CoA synthetase [Marinicauda algicola]
MGLFQAIRRELFYVTELSRLLRKLKSITPDSDYLTADLLEDSVDRHRRRPAFVGEGEAVSYAAFDARANRVANWALAQGLKSGDTVALYMGNRWDYIAIWYGLSKVGVVTALLNNQVTGKALAHGLTIAEARHVIVEGELSEAYATACDILECEMTAWVSDGGTRGIAGAEDFDAALQSVSDARPSREHRAHLRAKDACMKMYTSGTTGLPKAAIVAHTRALYYLQVFATLVRANPKDRMMMVLPLYHATGGLCGVGCALAFGGALIVRRKFSATRFWEDAVEHGATLFMYVGELCRFLVAADPHPLEKTHTIRAAIGNGLRPDVWPRFVKRTGIPRIVEFYGATEGNVGLVNLDSTPGAIGRIPPYLKKRFNVELVKFDMDAEAPVRDAQGRCIPCEPGEVGEAIGEIRPEDARHRFDGYQDREATEKKLLRNVFAEGDTWFRTGDLMRRDKLGYYYFVDRVGDTFRWKSENVATSEVAEVLGMDEGVVQANIYGVPVADYSGKAGMAALVVNEAFDLARLHALVHRELPHYARPLFLRIHQEDPSAHTTGTFKMKKTDLVKEGWDPDKVAEPLYFDDPESGAYKQLTPEFRARIERGDLRV